MSELEDRINSVLGDPQQMEQISRLAQQLMSGGGGMPPIGGAPSEPGMADKLSSVMSALGGDSGLPDIDPKLLSRIAKAVNASGKDSSEKRALLEAMKPYLSEKRRSKMDKAIKLARLASLARFALGDGEGDGRD